MNELSVHTASDQLSQIKRWPTTRSKAWVSRFVDSASHDDNIMAIVAVGSAVRPAVSSVDLDLVVVYRRSQRLKGDPPIEVDCRAYQLSQIDALLLSGNDMLGWAIKFGCVLFERNSYWSSFAASWQGRLPLPPVDVARQRAEDAFCRLASVAELGDFDAAHEQAVSYVTHLARAELLERKVYPASRPELPQQLRDIGFHEIARWLELLIDPAANHQEQITQLLQSRRLTKACSRRRPVRPTSRRG